MDRIKKSLPYVAILATGILIGLFFSGSDADSTSQQAPASKEESLYYTCSMHPQIHSETEGSCPLCGMELVATNTSSYINDNTFEMGDEAIALANIQTITIGEGSTNGGNVLLSGTIQPNENTNAVQTTLFDGRIDILHIKSVGEYVRKGDQIGVIYSPELYLAQDKLLTSASYKNTHEKLYNAARNSLGLWKMTDEQIDEVLESGKPMVNFPLIADVSGTVTEIIAQEGNYYKQGDALYRVSNFYSVWAVFDAYENQLGFLKKNQEIVIRLNALKGKEFKGRIDFIEPMLQSNKRTVSVRVQLSNPKGILKPGMFAEALISINEGTSMITIPKSAVLWTGKRSIVYRKPDPSLPEFEMVEVVLGNALSDTYEVLNGLSVGDEIVVNGTFTVDAAAQLSRKNSMLHSNTKPVEINRDIPKEGININSYAKAKVGDVLGTYLMLKDALVSSDLAKSKEMATIYLEILNAIELNNLDNDQIKQSITRVVPMVEKIARASKIEQMRNTFKPLSLELVALASSAPSFGQTIYVQYCPMADNNSGAPWLSLSENIRNPYFGDAMLTCGSIKEVLK